jgi:hypothetical protein
LKKITAKAGIIVRGIRDFVKSSSPKLKAKGIKNFGFFDDLIAK